MEYLPKVKGIKYFTTEPYIYPFIIAILIFISLVFSQSIGNTYYMMIGGAAILYFITRDRKIGFNTINKNTALSMATSIFYLIIFMIFSMVVLGVFQNVFSATTTFSTFLTANSAAFLGSAQAILATSPIMTAIVFGIIIAMVETFLYGRFEDFTLNMANVKFTGNRFVVLKQAKFWVINLILATAATWFHIRAKGIGADVTLLMVFAFFFLTGIIMVIPNKRGVREMETAVWLHIFNNSLAVAKTLRFI